MKGAVFTVSMAMTAFLAFGTPAQAFQFLVDDDDDARGMVVLEIPFGQSSREIQDSPELSFQFGMRKDYADQIVGDRFDFKSGARRPSFELEPLASWSIGEAVSEDAAEDDRHSEIHTKGP